MPTYTTTTHGLRWLQGGNLVSDIDAGFQALAEDVDAKLLTDGTSLPGSPVDGQQLFYVADATNGIVWHLRYRSASASASKWEFVGGSDLSAEVATSEGTTNTSYTDLATVGPTVTAPLAGDYRITFGARVIPASAEIGFIAVKLGASAAADAESLRSGSTSSGVSANTYPSRTIVRTLSAATALKLQYKTTSGATDNFADRAISIRPIRVG